MTSSPSPSLWSHSLDASVLLLLSSHLSCLCFTVSPLDNHSVPFTPSPTYHFPSHSHSLPLQPSVPALWLEKRSIHTKCSHHEHFICINFGLISIDLFRSLSHQYAKVTLLYYKTITQLHVMSANNSMDSFQSKRIVISFIFIFFIFKLII